MRWSQMDKGMPVSGEAQVPRGEQKLESENHKGEVASSANVTTACGLEEEAAWLQAWGLIQQLGWARREGLSHAGRTVLAPLQGHAGPPPQMAGPRGSTC